MSVRSFAQQKSALTRALKTQDPDERQRKVEAEVRRAIAEWNSREAPYADGWPDDWHRWDRALSDVGSWMQI
jgi:uncharacterized protein YPO0396